MEPASKHVVVVLDQEPPNRRRRADIDLGAATSSSSSSSSSKAVIRNNDEAAQRDGNSNSFAANRPGGRRTAARSSGDKRDQRGESNARQVVDEQQRQQQRENSKPKVEISKRDKLGGRVWRALGRTDRSASIELELNRMKMHEKLLLNGQQRLINQLRAGEKPANKVAPMAVTGGGGELQQYDHQAGQFKIQMAAATMAAADYDGSSSSKLAAIECRNLSYQAGLGAFRKIILHNLTLTVPEGAIYGLLGPSGCGKTTLLRCVAGRLKPEPESHVRVFGFQPNERGSQIPGPAIGYMPQEVSVYEEFTIDETLAYFGRINQMRTSLLRARIDFLLKFLNLPSKRRLIKTLSGGQKRRVSLAVALVHAPPLLILDEPTVGVDPLLRQVIWDYLVTLASSERITIVITTHYIEEARQANIVGLMRDGRLLAENNPLELMRAGRQTSLENVFLKLCINSDHAPSDDEDSDLGKRQGRADGAEKVPPPLSQKPGGDNLKVADDGAGLKLAESPSLKSATSDLVSSSSLDHSGDGDDGGEDRKKQEDEEEEEEEEVCNQLEERHEFIPGQYKSMERGQKYASKQVAWAAWCSILWAVTLKNMLRLRRNPPVLVFEFILPAFQVILFCLCIGGPPFDIPLAVVNEEIVPGASRLFLNSLNKQTFQQISYDNLSSAIESVRSGQNWAAVHIPLGYTHNLNDRLLHPADVANETLLNGTISIYPDLTNLHLALAIEGAFKDAFVKFSRDSLELLGYKPQLAELPIKMAEPVYGHAIKSAATATSGYLEFMAPGVVISITYVMATGLTALAFILEKRDGLLERSQISGVSTSQILLAHAVLQVFVMIFQIALVLAVTFYVFDVPSEGPFGWVALLILLQGCTGMAFGLLISAVCREENAAIMMLVGTFYINLILAGIMWPVEAMPKWLRPLSYLQPQTLPIVGLRNILSRGWSIDEPSVQVAYLTTLGWLLVFMLGAGLCMRYIK